MKTGRLQNLSFSVFFVPQPTSYTKSLESLVFIGISGNVGYPCNLHQTYIAKNVKKLRKCAGGVA